MIDIPSVIWKDSNGNERSVSIVTRLLKDRIVMCTGEVTDTLSESIVSQLLYLEAEDDKAPITLIVDGPGGSVIAGLSIIDTMNTISCPVSTIVTGQVASMSAMIALNGAKGQRKIMPNARVMLHSVASGMSGKIQDMQINFEETMKLQELLMEMIAKKCNKSLKTIKKDCDRDFWMNASEAITYGCCDKMVNSRK
jgi:ATP-dependent Clp protease protease subunit